VTYYDTLTDLATESETRVVAIYRAWQQGLLNTIEAEQLIAQSITAYNARGVALADLSLSATLTVQTGTVVTPLALTSALDDYDRLVKAANTLLAVQDLTDERVARLGRAEPLEAASRAYGRGIHVSKLVTGWTRVISPKACQLCQWWAWNGRVWTRDHPMPRHTGCTCIQAPVTKVTDNYQTYKNARRGQ
jgi:hypothetical protein